MSLYPLVPIAAGLVALTARYWWLHRPIECRSCLNQVLRKDTLVVWRDSWRGGTRVRICLSCYNAWRYGRGRRVDIP
jgi:hypothetical protein